MFKWPYFPSLPIVVVKINLFLYQTITITIISALIYFDMHRLWKLPALNCFYVKHYTLHFVHCKHHCNFNKRGNPSLTDLNEIIWKLHPHVLRFQLRCNVTQWPQGNVTIIANMHYSDIYVYIMYYIYIYIYRIFLCLQVYVGAHVINQVGSSNDSLLSGNKSLLDSVWFSFG